MINGEFDAGSRAERVEIAKALQQDVREFDRFLSAPKPEELAWVDRERKEIAALPYGKARNSRNIQLATSPELRHAQIDSLLKGVLSALSCVLDEKASIPSEMYCWAVVSLNMTDTGTWDESVSVFVKVGRLPRKFGAEVTFLKFDTSLNPSYWGNLYGRGILEYIVSPYLKQQAN